MPDTALTIITESLQELGILNATDLASAEDADLGLRRLNALFDSWNAERGAIYADTVTTYTLVPSTQPHTIGPSAATFTVTQRPVSIDAANLVDGSIRTPLGLRDRAWWMNLSDPASTGIPSDLFYEPGWPNGRIWFWPLNSTTQSIELLSRIVLANLALATTFTLPPGYRAATVLTLAEDLAPAFQVAVSPMTVEKARQARARIFGNNDVTPRLVTADAGMPGGGGGWDYRTGTFR